MQQQASGHYTDSCLDPSACLLISGGGHLSTAPDERTEDDLLRMYVETAAAEANSICVGDATSCTVN